jgi:hypothetical protein
MAKRRGRLRWIDVAGRIVGLLAEVAKLAETVRKLI